MSIKRKLYHLISGQLPEFVRTDHPRFVTFIEEYYKFLEQQGEVHDVLLNNVDWTDIDATLDVFLPYFRSQYTYDFPANTTIDNRKLIKYINQYYEAKGSETATEMFFRFMFNDTAEVKYPGDYLLRASDGRWSRKRFIKVDTTRFPDENIFELKEKIITLYYLEYIVGAGNFVRTITTRCLDVYQTSRPNIYQLQVDLNPNYVFPDDISADTDLAASLGNFDTHVYVQYVDDATTTTYGTISKQLTSVVKVDEAGSKFRRDDSYFISETGIEGLYFAGDYTEVTTGAAAYAYEALQNNAIVRVVKTENTLAEQYFLEDYTIFGDYASAPTRGKIKLLSIVDSGEKFLVRKTGVIESVTILDGGTGYAIGATSVNLVGDGSGAEFRVLVSGGKITQVTVLNGGANYSNEINPVTGLPLTTLTASGSGTGAVFELNISTDYTPVKTFTVDFNNGRAGSSPAKITFSTGHIYHAPGEYVDNAGFMSDIIKLQDNDYYQPYSYVIETTEQLSNWKTNYLESTHPAGFKMFSNLLLTGDLNVNEVTVEDDFTIIDIEDLPYRELEEVITTTEVVSKSFSRPVNDSLTVSESFNAALVYLQNPTDSVSTAETLKIDTAVGKLDTVITGEVLAFNTTKQLTDGISTSESTAFNTNISLVDTLTISDHIHQQFDQLDDATSDLQENLTISDAAALSTEYPFSESINNVDEVTLTYDDVNTETLALNDDTFFDISAKTTESVVTVTEVAEISFEHVTEDSVIMSDNLDAIDTNLGVSDVVNTVTEITSIDTDLAFSDVVNTTDTMIRNFNQQNDASSDLQEDLGLVDSASLETSYVFTDSQSNIDTLTVEYDKPSSDTISTSDDVTLSTEVSYTDTVGNTDTTTLLYNDEVSDTVTLSEGVEVLLVIPVSITDGTTVTDSIDAKNIQKPFTDGSTVADSVDSIDSSIVVSDTITNSDAVNISFSQVDDDTSDLQDNIALTDTTIFDVSLEVTDVVNTTDTMVREFNQQNDASSDLQEDISVGDGTAFVFSRPVSDTVNNTDSATILYNDVVSDTQAVVDATGTIVLESYFAGSYMQTQTTTSTYVGTVGSF